MKKVLSIPSLYIALTLLLCAGLFMALSSGLSVNYNEEISRIGNFIAA